MIMTEDFFSPEKRNAIQRLCALTQVVCDDFSGKDTLEMLESLNKVAQDNFLRKPGKERWDIKDNEVISQNRDAIVAILEELGLIQAIRPQKKTYDHVFLLGALQPAVQLRRESLERMVEAHHLEIQQVYLLGGERPLMEGKEAMFDSKKALTELDMMAADWDMQKTKMPKMLANLTPVLVNAVMNKVGGRPNTKDTIKCFLQLPQIQAQIAQKGHLGNVLVISNQPHCLYQDAVVRSILPKGTHIETVGNKASEAMTLGVGLDAFARWIYESYLRLKPTDTPRSEKGMLNQFALEQGKAPKLNKKNHNGEAVSSVTKQKTCLR